jgi:hypothetical protein
MLPPCPHCDKPDISLLRLVLISEILRTDETRLVLLADTWQQLGFIDLTEEPPPSTISPPRPLHLVRPLRHE